MSWASPVWRSVVLVLAPVLVFANSLRNGYHLDDFYRIVNNPHILSVGNPWRFFADPSTSSTLPTIVQYRPLMPFSFALGRALGSPLGLDPVVIDHLGSLLFHVIAVSLAFGWLWRMMRLAGVEQERAARVAGWASLLYAVHPVVGVPLNYLCSRDLLLMQLFVLAALNAWSRYRLALLDEATRHKAPRWAAGAVTLVLVSMLAKQNGVALPLVLLAFELVIVRLNPKARATYLGPLLFALAVAAFFVWTKFVIGFSDADQLNFKRKPWEYPAAMAQSHLFYYLRNAVWPFEMRMLPDTDVPSTLLDLRVITGALFISATLVFAWTRRITQPVICFAILAYWLMFAVTSSVRPFRYVTMDYRQVPSLPYLCLLAAWALEESRARMSQRGLHFVLVAYFAASTIHINGHWRDAKSLWGQAVRAGTRGQGHVNYGLAITMEDPQEALRHFDIALEDGQNIFALINRGITLFRIGRKQEALENLVEATTVAPGRSLTWYWLSRGHMMNADPQSALAPALRAVELETGNARYLAHLVRVELKVGQHDSAVTRLQASQLPSPELDELRVHLGL